MIRQGLQRFGVTIITYLWWPMVATSFHLLSPLIVENSWPHPPRGCDGCDGCSTRSTETSLVVEVTQFHLLYADLSQRIIWIFVRLAPPLLLSMMLLLVVTCYSKFTGKFLKDSVKRKRALDINETHKEFSSCTIKVRSETSRRTFRLGISKRVDCCAEWCITVCTHTNILFRWARFMLGSLALCVWGTIAIMCSVLRALCCLLLSDSLNVLSNNKMLH